jgi:hypothetical protein
VKPMPPNIALPAIVDEQKLSCVLGASVAPHCIVAIAGGFSTASWLGEYQTSVV